MRQSLLIPWNLYEIDLQYALAFETLQIFIQVQESFA